MRSIFFLPVFFLILLIFCFNLFWRIGSAPVATWDEARHIASAIEMWNSGDFLVNRYYGQPDYWNVKPPLSMWAAAVGYGIFDQKYLGVRFFSLVSTFLISVVIFFWVRRQKGEVVGLFAVALFITIPTIVRFHGFRTADPDMLFILFVTLSMWSASFSRVVFIYLAYVFLGFAFLTKSFHVIAYCVVIFFYSLLLLKKGLLRRRDVVCAPIAFFIPVLPWVVARFMVDGVKFFEVMFYYDLVKRSSVVIEGHHGAWWMYLYKISKIILLPLILCTVAFRRIDFRAFVGDSRGFLVLIWIAFPLILYSLAKSKLEWYYYPLLPAISICLALVLTEVFESLTKKWRLVFGLVLVLHFCVNELRVVSSVLKIQPDPVQSVLAEISSSTRKASVYMNSLAPGGVWRQDYYAASLLIGNVNLKVGGVASFEADAGPSFLIDESGKVVGRKE